MYRKFGKRALDIFVSLLTLPFVVLVIVLMAPFIWLEDRGPIFYNAYRVGKDGRQFKMFKLRSMYVNAPDIRNADGSTFNSANDPRVTRIGKLMRKTSLDEFPQFLNVLIGDMSLIGPRPATPKILENTTPLQAERMKVRPGITGYTQMKYRNSAQGEARYQADKYYVDNLSFGMDFNILFGTLLKVLKREDVFNDGKETANNAENVGGQK